MNVGDKILEDIKKLTEEILEIKARLNAFIKTITEEEGLEDSFEADLKRELK